jgi:hypothetical protein
MVTNFEEILTLDVGVAGLAMFTLTTAPNCANKRNKKLSSDCGGRLKTKRQSSEH